MSKRFLLTILTLAVIGVTASIAIFVAKGYRVSPQTKTFSGTGIISATSIPDQASVYLDDHLSTATNANITSLPPKVYTVKIVKEGYITWQKQVEVKEGLVTEVKATLFPAIPSMYPLTFNGINKIIVSLDEQRFALVVPGSEKKSGVWVWDMNERGLGFTRGREPHQVALNDTNTDYTKAVSFEFSPDSTEIMAILPEKTVLLDASRLNDPPRDITASIQPTRLSWDLEFQNQRKTQIQAIKDPGFRKTASESARIKWSQDGTKFLVSSRQRSEVRGQRSDNQKSDSLKPDSVSGLTTDDSFKVIDITEKKTYDLPAAYAYMWLSDSRHLLMVSPVGEKSDDNKISVIEFDGQNEAVIYAGNFDKSSVFPWFDASRVAFVTTLPTPTASTPNLYGINLK